MKPEREWGDFERECDKCCSQDDKRGHSRNVFE